MDQFLKKLFDLFRKEKPVDDYAGKLTAAIGPFMAYKWERSGYMNGFCDGMIYARSLINNETPKYLEDFGKIKEEKI